MEAEFGTPAMMAQDPKGTAQLLYVATGRGGSLFLFIRKLILLWEIWRSNHLGFTWDLSRLTPALLHQLGSISEFHTSSDLNRRFPNL
jgi:hypothetical protein